MSPVFPKFVSKVGIEMFRNLTKFSSSYQDPLGKYIVLYTFKARDENDINVERGDVLTVLNKDDPDWHWVVRNDGQEGFVPAAFIYPVNQSMSPTVKTNTNDNNQQSLGSELVLLYDYKVRNQNIIHSFTDLSRSHIISCSTHA